MSSSAMAAAFQRAGVINPADRLAAIAAEVLRDPTQWAPDSHRDDPIHTTRLREIAMEAAKTNRRNFEAARGRLYKVVRGDAALLWAMFEPYRSMAADRLLRDGYSLLAAQEKRSVDEALRKRDAGKPAGGGYISRDTHSPAVPATNAGESRRNEGATHSAASTTGAPPRSNLTVLADKQAAAMAQRAATEIRLSRLDTVLVDGKPIGDCTFAEVRRWAEMRAAEARAAGRDARFAQALLALGANIPGSAVVRQYWQDADEVERIYQHAEAEYAA